MTHPPQSLRDLIAQALCDAAEHAYYAAYTDDYAEFLGTKEDFYKDADLLITAIELRLPEKKKFINFEDKSIDDMDATYVGGYNSALSDIKQLLGGNDE